MGEMTGEGQVYGDFRPGDVTTIRDPADGGSSRSLVWCGAVIVFREGDYAALGPAILSHFIQAAGEILRDGGRAAVIHRGAHAEVLAVRREFSLPGARVRMLSGRNQGREGWVWLDTLTPLALPYCLLG